MILTNILTDGRERTRFIRFAIVGTIGALVDFGTFNLLASVLGIHYVLASVCSFIVAMVNNFLWNRYWTFPDSRSKSASQQLIQFSVVNVIGLAIRTPLFAVLSSPLQSLFDLLPFLPVSIFDAEMLGHNLALAIAVIVVLFWNFIVNRKWTFSDIE
jgi:putative flippase GtrA